MEQLLLPKVVQGLLLLPKVAQTLVVAHLLVL